MSLCYHLTWLLGVAGVLTMVASAAGAVAGAGAATTGAVPPSTLEALGQQPLPAAPPTTEGAKAKVGELRVEIIEAGAADDRLAPLAARVTITAADGSHPDGSGRGVYSDGRFFADGAFTVPAPVGVATMRISCGPHFVPLEVKVDVPAGQRGLYRARMQRWFDPAALGWYAGDNHVHTQHDAQAAIRTDPGFTALQGRADGLSFITEADPVPPERARGLDTPTFLYRVAPEVRPGPFVGHLNTPGIAHPIPAAQYDELVRHPLPRQSLHATVRELGGVMIHTHPLTPPQMLHWMGAAEAWSDAVLGQTADLLDVDSPASEQLWFAMLNLDNRIGCSSYTDCALGRRGTSSPGDRRVYCRADRLDYGLIVEAMRRGRTVATSGGPLFLTMTLGGRAIGDVLRAEPARAVPLRVECHSLLPLRTVQVYHAGQRGKAYDGAGRTGRVLIEDELVPATDHGGWYVARAENQKGDWAITSPVYVEPAGPPALVPPAPASALLLEISNHTRFIELRRQFFAHLIVTVRPPEGLAEVRLLRDTELVHAFRPAEGDQWHNQRVPVTDINGEYGPGWAWHPAGAAKCHLQADWPVDETGWYAIEATTTTGRTLRSHAVRFDSAEPNSRALSAARLDGAGTSLSLLGYGGDMPLSEVRLPFEGDHWWYPQQTFWQLRARFQDQQREFHGGDAKAAARFREPAMP